MNFKINKLSNLFAPTKRTETNRKAARDKAKIKRANAKADRRRNHR